MVTVRAAWSYRPTQDRAGRRASQYHAPAPQPFVRPLVRSVGRVLGGAIVRSNYAVVSGVVFGVVAIIQAIRAFNQWPVQIGPFAVPVWFSWIALVVAGGLCIWAFRSARS